MDARPAPQELEERDNDQSKLMPLNSVRKDPLSEMVGWPRRTAEILSNGSWRN